jgi:hypothetical protein
LFTASNPTLADWLGFSGGCADAGLASATAFDTALFVAGRTFTLLDPLLRNDYYTTVLFTKMVNSTIRLLLLSD